MEGMWRDGSRGWRRDDAVATWTHEVSRLRQVARRDLPAVQERDAGLGEHGVVESVGQGQQPGRVGLQRAVAVEAPLGAVHAFVVGATGPGDGAERARQGDAQRSAAPPPMKLRRDRPDLTGFASVVMESPSLRCAGPSPYPETLAAAACPRLPARKNRAIRTLPASSVECFTACMTGASHRPADGEAGRATAGVIPEPRASGEPSPEPFRAFYQREYRGLVALAASLIGDRYMAEDIAQDALFVASRRWISRRSSLTAVSGMAVVANKSVSLIRRRLAAASPDSVGSLADRRADEPESDEDFWASSVVLRRQAQVVALHYVSDMSVVEIAATLGCKEGSVKASLFKARQRLLKSFETSSGEVRAVGKPVTH